MSKETGQIAEEMKEVLEMLKNMTEVEKLRFVMDRICQENTQLREELQYKKMNDYVVWWNSVKDKLLI